MFTGSQLDLIGLIGLILLIGIVKKNAIMIIDFALEAERSRGLPADGSHSRGRAAALPSDSDDHTGRRIRGAAARDRFRRRLGTAPPARHRHHRRADRKPVPDAAQHAGCLSRARPFPSPRRRTNGCSRDMASASNESRHLERLTYDTRPGDLVGTVACRVQLRTGLSPTRHRRDSGRLQGGAWLATGDAIASRYFAWHMDAVRGPAARRAGGQGADCQPERCGRGRGVPQRGRIGRGTTRTAVSVGGSDHRRLGGRSDSATPASTAGERS